MSTMNLTRLILPVCLIILVVERAVPDQVDVQIAENVTATLCSTKHLCQNKGCTADSNRNTACQCDRACTFFDDCCVDYAVWCSHEQNDGNFLDRLGVASFQCTSVKVDTEGVISNRNFWIVKRCPDFKPTTGNVSVIRTSCETPTSDNPLTLIPQTNDRNVTFANVYCALCHGRPRNELRAWDLQTSCPEPVYNSLANANFTTKLRTIWNECGHHFVLPQIDGYGASGLTSRPCLTQLVGDSCDNSSTDAQVADACRNFTAVVRSTTRTYYKNPICYAICALQSSMEYTLDCLSSSFPLIRPRVVAVPDQSSPTVNYSALGGPQFPQIMSDSYDEYTDTSLSRVELAPKDEPLRVPLGIPLGPTPSRPIVSSLSDIVDFNPSGDVTEYSCPEGDLHDPFSNMCLSPLCDRGFVFNRFQESCVPVPIPLAIQRFGCFDGRNFPYVRDSLFITVDVNNSFETGGNSFQQSLEQCIRESLDVDLVYLDETVDREDFLEDGDGEMLLLSQRDGQRTSFRIVPPSLGELNETAEFDANDAIVAKLGRWLLAVGQSGDGAEDGEAVDEDGETFGPCRIQDLQVIQSCGDSLWTDQLNSCNQTEWIPTDNDKRIQMNNRSLIVFDTDQQSWYTVSRYNIRIRYQKRIRQESIIFNQSRVEIGVCGSSRTRVSCPFIKLDSSQFESLDDDDLNGSLVFKPKGITLNQDEYIRTADGEIKVCASLGLLDNQTYERSLLDFNLPQAILSTIGLSISVTASTLTLITYAVFPSLHRRTRKAIMAMVTSLTAAQILFLFSGLIAAANQHACTAAAIASHFLWLSSLTWTNVLAFLLWSTFAKKSPSPSTSQLSATSRVTALTFAYAFGIPLGILIPCAVVNFCSCTDVPQIYGSSGSCWINSGLTNFVVFGVPMGVFLLINTILFVWTVWVIRSSQRRSAQLHTGRDKSTLRRGTKEVLVYIRIASLMGFTWVFGFSAAFADVPALSYIFIVLNSLQGLFIFLSFTFTSQVKKLWRRKLASQLSYVGCFSFSKSHTDKTATTSTSVSAGVSASEAALEMRSKSLSTGGGIDVTPKKIDGIFLKKPPLFPKDFNKGKRGENIDYANNNNTSEEINKLRHETANQYNWKHRLVPVRFSKQGHQGVTAEPQNVEARPKPIIPPKPRLLNNDSGSQDQPRSPHQPQSAQRPLPRVPFTSDASWTSGDSDAGNTKPLPLPKRRNVQTIQE